MREAQRTLWQAALEEQGLRTPSDYFAFDAPWVEAPNERRGGTSGVKRLSFRCSDGSKGVVYCKLQQEYVRRSWRHPLRGELTAALEAKSLRRLAEHGLRAACVLSFAEELHGGRRRAVLVTPDIGLAGFFPLLQAWNACRGRPERTRLLGALADYLRRMHQAGCTYNALYPKHIFVRQESGGLELCLIDAEKARWSRPRLPRLRDLDTLNRRSLFGSRSDRLRLLLTYLAEDRSGLRELWRRLARRAT